MPGETRHRIAPDRQAALMLRLEIDELNTRYAAVLDRGDLRQWPDFFDDDPIYRLTSRENVEANLPIGLIYCDSRGMLEDRAEAILSTTVYTPRSILHFITNIELGAIEPDGVIPAQANFLLVENMIDRNPKLLMAGFYRDRLVRRNGSLLFRERHCIYETLTIQTSVIFPV